MTALIGFGSHGRDVAAIWQRTFPGVALWRFDDHSCTTIAPPPGTPGPFYFGVNDSKTRRELAERFSDPAPPLIDLGAIVGSNCRIADGCVISPGAVLLTEVILGIHTHVHYGASMTRCHIGNFVTIGPGAVICGDVTIGDEAMIGAGAIISDRVTIGARCVIGAGAIVPPTRSVPDDTTVIGVFKGVKR